ncbi:MAG: VUT family protein, partial [Sphingomonas bacterium]|nr:VUT family protein [Sphingomonas bacterium]
MTDPAPAAPAAITISKGLFAFALLYGGMTCIAGVLGSKQVALGPLAVEAGIFPFLLLVALSSAIAELYGRATADRLVRFGFVPLVTAMILTFIVIEL